VLLAAAACVGVGVSAAAFAVTRTGLARAGATALAVVALAAAVVLQLAAVGSLLVVALLVALLVIGAAATRYALGRDMASLKHAPTPGDPVGPARRPVLLMNPRSGGGKVDRFGLVEEARRRGIEPVVLAPGDDLLRLAEAAVAEGADVIGMAGGDGSQALVAGVAAARGVAFVCVPAGTRNHLAMDLGLDRGDVAGALDAFGEAVERRVDLGLVSGRVFVNNATVGLYAKIVQSPAYRDRKVGTALELLPEMLGPRAVPFDLRFTGPDGTEHASAHLILVSNDRYQLGSGEGFGSRRHRRRLPRHRRRHLPLLGRPRPPARIRRRRPQLAPARLGRVVRRPLRPALRPASGDRHRRRGDAARPAAGVPHPPRRPAGPHPRHAPGYFPAAAAPPRGWAAVTALLQTAAGRPVAIAA